MTRVGLALGGGGARGAAHFGVLKVFEEERIPIDLIAGTSMGAIVGAMYAQNPDASAVIEKYEHFIANMDYGSFGLKYIAADADQDSHLLQKFARTIAQRIYMSSMGHRSGIMKPEFLDKALKELLDRGNVQDTKIPFGAVATDLNSGNTILIPGYLPPEEEGAKLITDGGVSEPVPVDSALKMGADAVIAVSVDPAKLPDLEDPSMINIMRRCDLIRGIHMSRAQVEKADVCLCPDMSGSDWSEFLSSGEFIKAGEEEARKKLPLVREALRRKRPWFLRIFSN